MSKSGGKNILTIVAAHIEHVDALVSALKDVEEFKAFFTFKPLQTGDLVHIVAEGSWHLPGNMRPAHGTMQIWAKGYLQCLIDNAARSENTL